MKITIWVVVFLLITTMLCAVNVVIGGSGICNGPDESPCPYGNFYRNERVQCIIEAAEIHAAGGGAGPINSVSLNVFQLNDVGLQSDNEICKLCSEICKLSHRRTSLLILSKTPLRGL